MNQLTLNKKIDELIRSKDAKGESYSKEDKKLLVQYEGSGGQGSTEMNRIKCKSVLIDD